MRKGIYFTFDSLIAAVVLIMAILLASSFYIKEQQRININYAAQDLIVLFSSLKVGDLKIDYVQRLVNSSDITNENLTVLEQIGDFWAQDKAELAKNFTKILMEDTFPSAYGFSVLVNGDLIYVRDLPVTTSLVSTRKIVSGIAKAKPTDGFTSRVLLAGIKSKKTSAYAYFGGYEGDGNLTKKINLPDKIISIDSAYLELGTGGKFNLYINNIPSGTYVKGSGGGGNMLADKWNISGAYLSNFKTGENIIYVNFTSGNSYIAGGFLRVTYITNVTNDAKKPGIERYEMPGINGIINLYSSFYAPSKPESINISLHFKSEYQTYLDIGNISVYQTNGSPFDQVVILNDSSLAKLLNYSKLKEKTIPLRLGLRNVNSTIAETVLENIGKDTVLITDRTTSMDDCDVEVDCGTPGYCKTKSGKCYQKRWIVAKNADKKFIDSYFNTSGNKLALAGFGSSGDVLCDVHEFSDDNASLKNRTEIYESYDNTVDCGPTCISCGILGSTKLLIEQERLHGLNQVTNISRRQFHLGSGQIIAKQALNVTFDKNKFIKSRLSIMGRNVDSNNRKDCILFNKAYIGKMCKESSNHTCSYPLRKEWFSDGNSNNVTITGGTNNDCYGSGSNDEWDLEELRLDVWESHASTPKILYNSSSGETKVGAGSPDVRRVLLNFTIYSPNVNIRAALLEFEAIDVDASLDECVFINGNYAGKINYQRWNGTNQWQPIIFDVPAAWVKNGTNEINFTAGSSDNCYETSGNKDWRFRKVNLTLTLTDDMPALNSTPKSMVLMTDGEATATIPGAIYGTQQQANDETVQKACEARRRYGISIYAVAFGNSADRALLQQVACCDNCSHFYTTSSADELYSIYNNISQTILATSSNSSLSFHEQTFSDNGSAIGRTVLYPDSYVDFNYLTDSRIYFNKIPLSFETPRFDNGVSSGIFTVYPNTTVQDAVVTSYSESKWTDNLAVNGINAYRLSDYGKDYQILGDPFAVNIPVIRLNAGDNSILVSTGINSTSSAGGSKDDKVIYTLLLKGATDYTNVVPTAKGCSWSVVFEDGTSSTIKVPKDYSGASACDFANKIYDNSDSLDISVYQLFANLDIDKDGKLDVKIDADSLSVESLTISKVPSLWGPAIIEIRVWE